MTKRFKVTMEVEWGNGDVYTASREINDYEGEKCGIAIAECLSGLVPSVCDWTNAAAAEFSWRHEFLCEFHERIHSAGGDSDWENFKERKFEELR